MEFSVADIHEAIATSRPDATCLVFRDQRLTWAEVTERTRRLANHLIGQGLGVRVERDELAGVGSVLLIPELLSKPMRDHADQEVEALGALLARLDLRPTDAHTARLATALAASYRLRAADAIHLATAVNAGATRFLTNNSKDFQMSISEIDVVYPADLSDV